ncbi:MAG: hypothetical protein K6F05_05950 [Succinivibrio sp.]|nr:hypothetical protein [Succinivibrio sp.]
MTNIFNEMQLFDESLQDSLGSRAVCEECRNYFKAHEYAKLTALLKQQREKQRSRLHQVQNRLDTLDYLIYSLEHNYL